MDWFPTIELREKALDITARLQAVYHAAPDEPCELYRLPAVDELIFTILSQSTTDINTWRGYRALVEQFDGWDAVAHAPVEQIAAAIQSCGLSNQKAPRIKSILLRLQEEQAEITLDFLRGLPPDEAIAYLMSFHGIGRKTASCVLLFSLGMPAMPVDTHVLRIATRLRLIPDNTSADAAHDLLESLLPEEAYLAFHVNLIMHGRRTCLARNPACERCAVHDLCPWVGRVKLGKADIV